MKLTLSCSTTGATPSDFSLDLVIFGLA